jgi:hypothetical protein
VKCTCNTVNVDIPRKEKGYKILAHLYLLQVWYSFDLSNKS